jgi:uncharacterized protein with HEPN domain
MSPRDWQVRVKDITDATREILAFMSGLDFESFRQDVKTIRAVELNFIIIGEAASGIPDDVLDAHPEIPWHLMRSMRNRLVHVYFEVDPKLVWDTVKNDIPPLIASLEKLLN